MSLIAVFCLLLGIYILKVDLRNSTNRLLGAVCIVVSLWHIDAIIAYTSPAQERIIASTIFASFCF